MCWMGTQHLFVARHGRDKRVGDALRISVQQADPLDALHGVQRIQKLRDLHPAAVRAEGRDVLRHNNELFYAFTRQKARFGHNIRDGTAAQRAADERDGAVMAAVVAALGDF